MLSLCTKGVEDILKVKNRIARLYGAGRISEEDFLRLDKKINDLRDDLTKVQDHGVMIR